MTELRLALIQHNPTVGDIDGNAALALDMLRANQDADLVVFSECFLSGYPLNDLVLRPGFLSRVAAGIDGLRQQVMELGGPAILIGAPLAGSGLPYNAAFLIEASGAIRIVRKTELPNADVFDERRTFAHATDERPVPLSFRGFRLGVQICEDMWHGPVSRSLADELADVLIVLNGSPYQRGKVEERLDIARARVRATGLPLVYVNQVGGQDELVFDGNSFTLGTAGEILQARAFAPDTLRIVLRRSDAGRVTIAPDGIPAAHKAADTPLGTDYQACVLGLQDYVRKIGSSRVFVGVSGGLDSALVLTMAADALGPENVVGVMMPSLLTGTESLTLAADLMRRLAVHAHILPIGPAYDAVSSDVAEAWTSLAGPLGVQPREGIARENFQARIRGMALLGLSNALGGIVLSTGNKSEMSVGYATLYGDMAGEFNPLKSVWKSDAFRMAEWRNLVDPQTFGFLGASNPIPAEIIARPPTAELAEGQTDAKSLGDYAALDIVLRALVEDRLDTASAARRLASSFSDPEILALIGTLDVAAYAGRIAGLVRGAQYKRNQAPPGVKLNATDFGLGWRYPIAGTYTL